MISQHDPHFLPHLSGNIGKLTTAHSLRSFALVMVDVFLPIFLLTKGIGLPQVLLYEAFVFTLHACLEPVTYEVSARYGIKLTMAVGAIFTTLTYVGLFLFDQLSLAYSLPVLLLCLAATSAIGETAFWNGFHLDFALKSDANDEGSQFGTLEAISIGLRTLAPIVGAVFITFLSFNASFFLVLCILIASMVPLFLSENVILGRSIKVRRALSLRHIRLSLLYVVEGFNHIAQAFIWPLLLFVVKFSLLAIGGLTALATLLTSISSFMSGKFTDKYGLHRVFKFGAAVNGSSLFLRPLFDSALGAFLFQGLSGASGPFFKIPLIVTTYRKAREEAVEVLITRDVYINIGRVVFLVMSAGLVTLAGSARGLAIALVIGGFATVGIGYLAKFLKEPV